VALFAQEAGYGKLSPVYAVSLAEKVNMRAGQGVNFEVLGRLNKADEVVVIGEGYGWYMILLPATAVCFVHRDYVEQGVVKANRLRVRAAGRLNANVLGMLKKGQRVKVLAEEGDWLKIMPPAGCSGWVKKNYLELSKRKFVPRKAVVSKTEDIPPHLSPLPKGEKKMEGVGSLSQEKGKVVEVYGKIDDLGKIFNRQATHKLIEGKMVRQAHHPSNHPERSRRKILYYLKSEALDLNRFIYDRVCVIGRLLDLENSPYPVIDVKEIRQGQ